MKLNQVFHEDDEFAFDISPIGNDRPSVTFEPTDKQPAISDHQSTDNPPDKISLDVPLLIRLMEWAREDAEDDMQLHSVTEKLVAMSRTEQTLSMRNYDDIISCCALNNKKVHNKS